MEGKNESASGKVSPTMKSVKENVVNKLSAKAAAGWLDIGIIVGKALFYSAVILFLIYLYHYRHIGGGSFIYNEF